MMISCHLTYHLVLEFPTFRLEKSLNTCVLLESAKATGRLKGLITISANYQSASGKTFNTLVKIDLSHFNNVLYESYREAQYDVAKQIQELRRFFEFNNRPDRMANWSKKPCSECKGLIKNDALKCMYCGSEQQIAKNVQLLRNPI